MARACTAASPQLLASIMTSAQRISTWFRHHHCHEQRSRWCSDEALLACAAAAGMEDADAEFGGMATNMALYVDAWDAGCPWRPWAVHTDPVGVSMCYTLDIAAFAYLTKRRPVRACSKRC